MLFGAGPAVVAALFVFALALRAIAFLRTDVIFEDGPIFLAIAGEMSAGRWREALAYHQHPGYPLLIHWTTPIFGDAFAAATVVSLVAGSLAVVALYAFLVQAWDRRVAVAGALLLAVSPYAVRFSADVQSEPLYLACFLAAVAMLFAALRRGTFGPALLAGALAGLAYGVRPEGLGVAFVGLVLAGVAWLRGGWSAGRTLAWQGALALGTALVAGPYLLVVRAVTGELRISQKKSLLAILGLEPGGLDPASVDPAAIDPFTVADAALLAAAVVALLAAAYALTKLRGTAAARVRVGPLSLAAGFAALGLAAALGAPDSFGVFAATVVSTLRPEVLLLFAIGVIAGARRGPSGRTLFVAAFVGLYAVVSFGLLLGYGYLSRRHVQPPLALLLGYAASGALVLIDALAGWLRGRGLADARAARAASAAAFVLLLAIALPKAWHAHRAEEVPTRLAAEWLRDHAEGEGALASTRRKYAWYAGREWRTVGAPGALVSLAELRAQGVRFVLVEDAMLGPIGRPPVIWREDQSLALDSRHEVTDGERRVVVFELVARAS